LLLLLLLLCFCLCWLCSAELCGVVFSCVVVLVFMLLLFMLLLLLLLLVLLLLLLLLLLICCLPSPLKTICESAGGIEFTSTVVWRVVFPPVTRKTWVQFPAAEESLNWGLWVNESSSRGARNLRMC
jgi:hypothetical protein